MRGRPPKPTKILELSGAYAKNPQRRRARAAIELKVDGELGGPPQIWIDKAAHSQESLELLGIWYELVEQAPAGILTSADRLFVELACRLMYKVRFRKSTAGDYAQLNRYLEQIRLTPSGRARGAGSGSGQAIPQRAVSESRWSQCSA